MSASDKDLINETVFSTPKPNATSTVQKQHPLRRSDFQRVAFNVSADISTDSLGVLQSHELNSTSALDVLQKQRNLAASLLQKSYNLPSKYLKSSQTPKSAYNLPVDSTVNESDLLSGKYSFAPNEISTPRSSCVSSHDGGPKSSIGHISVTENLTQLSEQLAGTDMSLSELFEQFYLREQQETDVEESFLPSELALSKIAMQERSWRRENDVLGGNSIKSDSVFFNGKFSEFGSSISDFFRKRSELADLCLKVSPEKESTPTPLIEQSTNMGIFECTDVGSLKDESVLSVTQFEQAISPSDNTATIMNLFRKPLVKSLEDKHKKSNKENRGSLGFFAKPSLRRTSNIVPLQECKANITDGSINSVHTSSSIASLPGGKLPIECNKIELIWGCVPIGKKKSQTFMLRNKSQNKLRLNLKISNSSFTIVNEGETDHLSNLPVLLYPAEARSFTIIFNPISIGATVGKLDVLPFNSQLQQKQTKRQQLYFYAYGGSANVEFQNVAKDSNLKMWLSLGKLSNTSELIQTFNIRNVGTLTAFTYLSFTSKSLHKHNVLIETSANVLKPKESRNITVSFVPTKDDVKHVFATNNLPVIEIGWLQVISGAEALRGRIRRLFTKLKQEGGVVSNPIIEQLSRNFPNEDFPADLCKVGETVGCMKDLLQNLTIKEIILTIERDSDFNLIGQIVGIEESSMFHSLAEGMTTIMSNTCVIGSCKIEPSSIILTPPLKIEDNIVLSSHSVKCLRFKTTLSEDVLQVSPTEGLLNPNETVLLNVSYDATKMKQLLNRVFKLSVYVDDEVFNVDVKIILVNQKGCM